MTKYLFNQTAEDINIESLGIILESQNEYEISYEMIHVFVENPEIIALIQVGKVQVGTEGSLINDPAAGEAFFRTMLGDQAFVAFKEDVTRYDNIIVEDPLTDKHAVAFFMNTLTMMRELYNAKDNPVYLPGFQQILGEGGWAEDHADRINTLELIHAKMGWHRQEIYSYGRERPLDLLIYYGYPNSFNSAVNGWNNENVAQDMAKYNLIVLGEGVQDPTHPDYANTQIIIARVKVLNPYTKIFGYLDMTWADWEVPRDDWAILGVHGIFWDKAGYDYGTPDTNGRMVMVEKVESIHDMQMICFVNAWNMDHIIGTADDPSYPNSTWNPDLEESGLGYYDWYLLESFAVNTAAYPDGYAPKSDWTARGVKSQTHRVNYGINLASVGIIDDAHASGQDIFRFGYVSALMWSLEANGTSSNSYGSATAQVAYWNRASVSEMGRIWNLNASVQENGNVCMRYVDNGRFVLDFLAGAQVSTIEKY